MVVSVRHYASKVQLFEPKVKNTMGPKDDPFSVLRPLNQGDENTFQLHASVETIERMREMFRIMDHALSLHQEAGMVYKEDELIEPWTPTDQGVEDPIQISCPEFTIGLLMEAREIAKKLKIAPVENS